MYNCVHARQEDARLMAEMSETEKEALRNFYFRTALQHWLFIFFLLGHRALFFVYKILQCEFTIFAKILGSGEAFDPSRSYTSMLHLAASDLAYVQFTYISTCSSISSEILENTNYAHLLYPLASPTLLDSARNPKGWLGHTSTGSGRFRGMLILVFSTSIINDMGIENFRQT